MLIKKSKDAVFSQRTMDVSNQIFAGSAAILKVATTERVSGKSVY